MRMVQDPDLIQDLCLPRAYPHPVAEIRCVPRPGRLSFCAGPYRYELLLPIGRSRSPGELLAREQRCRAALKAHEGLAPGLYLDLVPLRRTPLGHLHFEGDGELADWALRSRRLPEEDAFGARLARGAVDDGCLREIARGLAGWHLTAPTGPGIAEHASPEALRSRLEASFRDVESHVSPRGVGEVLAPLPTTPTLLRLIQARLTSFLDAHLDLIEERRHEGRIREGHGQLRVDAIFCPRTGPLFCERAEDPQARTGDVIRDLSGLLVDLDLRGARRESRLVFDAWCEETGDVRARELLPFYKSMESWERGREAMNRALAAASGEPVRRLALEEARSAFNLAAAYLLPPGIVLLCGLPGSGKTWIAEHLAPIFETALLHGPEEGFGAEIPCCRSTGGAREEGRSPCGGAPERTYRELLEQARQEIARGRTVIVDATFARRSEREPFLDLARQEHHPFLLIEVTAEPRLAVRRLWERLSPAARNGGGAEEDDLGQVQHRFTEAVRDFEPPCEVPAFARVTTDGQLTPGEVALLVLHRLAIHEPLASAAH